MKLHKKLCYLLLCAVMLTGCSQNTPEEMPDIDTLRQSPETTAETQAEPTTEEFVPTEIYYLTDHGTQDSKDLTKFRTQLETDGFLWNEGTISEIPAKDSILILNAPQEDITQEEFQMLKDYKQIGGDMLILLPASESETRYKFLNNLLETYCIQLDYDKISETDNFRIKDDAIRLNYIAQPDRMTAYEESMLDSPVYMRNMRSFHLLGDYATDEMFVDVMLQTAETAIGEPFGGVEDDPLTYENQKLDILVYSLDTIQNNTCAVVCGASDFLLDENFEKDTSHIAQEWIYSSLQWFTTYNSY